MKFYRWKEGIKFIKYKNQTGIFDLIDKKVCKISGRAYSEINKYLTDKVSSLNTEYEELFKYLIKENYIVSSTVRNENGSIKYKITPKIVYYEITSRCNLNCKTCFANTPGFKRRKELSFEKVVELLNILFTLKCVRLDISGGEPLLRKDILKILEVARDKFQMVNLYTNGTLIVPDMARQLKDLVYYIQVSLDGSCEVNDAIRGEGSFDLTMKGLYNLKRAGMERVIVKLTVTPENVNYISEVNSFISKEFGYHVDISLFTPLGSAVKNYDCTIALRDCEKGLFRDFQRLISFLLRKDIMEAFGDQKLFYKFMSEVVSNMGEYPCALGRKNTIDITPDGKVKLCSFFRESRFILGNIFDVENWLKKFEELYVPAVDEIPSCKNCYVRYLCGGGCRGMAYSVYRDMMSPFPYCKFFKSFYTLMFWELGEEGLSPETVREKIQEFQEFIKQEISE